MQGGVAGSRAAARLVGRASPIWAHDYHLFLVPGMLRARLEESAAHGSPIAPEVLPFVQFFLHIPWPDPGAWRALPRAWAREVCESLLACDVAETALLCGCRGAAIEKETIGRGR